MFCGIALIAAVVLIADSSSCTARQFSMVEDIVQYEQTLDPNMCVALAEKIAGLNADCNAGLETVDCG